MSDGVDITYTIFMVIGLIVLIALTIVSIAIYSKVKKGPIPVQALSQEAISCANRKNERAYSSRDYSCARDNLEDSESAELLSPLQSV